MCVPGLFRWRTSLFVVEFVSPSTARTDRVSKQAEYAAVGIRQYLIVDLRDGVEELIDYLDSSMLVPLLAGVAQAALPLPGCVTRIVLRWWCGHLECTHRRGNGNGAPETRN